MNSEPSDIRTAHEALEALAPYAPLAPGHASDQLQVRHLLGIDPATPLTEAERQRFHRLLIVLERATEVHRTAREAALWCLQELPALGRQTPIQKCRTEKGYLRVLHLLGQIEHGIFG